MRATRFLKYMGIIMLLAGPLYVGIHLYLQTIDLSRWAAGAVCIVAGLIFVWRSQALHAKKG